MFPTKAVEHVFNVLETLRNRRVGNVPHARFGLLSATSVLTGIHPRGPMVVAAITVGSSASEALRNKDWFCAGTHFKQFVREAVAQWHSL